MIRYLEKSEFGALAGPFGRKRFRRIPGNLQTIILIKKYYRAPY